MVSDFDITRDLTKMHVLFALGLTTAEAARPLQQDLRGDPTASVPASPPGAQGG